MSPLSENRPSPDSPPVTAAAPPPSSRSLRSPSDAVISLSRHASSSSSSGAVPSSSRSSQQRQRQQQQQQQQYRQDDPFDRRELGFIGGDTGSSSTSTSNARPDHHRTSPTSHLRQPPPHVDQVVGSHDQTKIPDGRFARLMDSLGRSTGTRASSSSTSVNKQQQERQPQKQHFSNNGFDGRKRSGSGRPQPLPMDQGYSHSNPGNNGYGNGTQHHNGSYPQYAGSNDLNQSSSSHSSTNNGVNPSNLSTTGYNAHGGPFMPGTNPSWPGTGGSSHHGQDFSGNHSAGGHTSANANADQMRRGSVYGDYSPNQNHGSGSAGTGEMGPGSYGSMNSAGGLRNPGGHFGGSNGAPGGGGPSFAFDMQQHATRRKFGNGSGMEDDDMHGQSQYYHGGGNESSNNGSGGKKRKVSIRDEDEDDDDDDDDDGSMTGNNDSSRGKHASRGVSSGAGGGGDKDDERRKKSGKERPGRGKGMRRGARACTNCRRGKNRCEGDHPCNRCAAQNLECVFAKPPPKPPNSQQHGNGNTNGSGNGSSQLQQNQPSQPLRMGGNMSMSMGLGGMGMSGMGTGNGMQGNWNPMGDPEGRFMHIESSVNHLAASQNQMQSTLSQILSALSQNQMGNQKSNQNAPQLNFPQPSPPHNNGMGSSQGSLSIQHHGARNISGADLFNMNNLAPPDAQDSARLDPFSPGTVAALTEVAVANGYTGATVGLVHDGNVMDATYSPSVGTSAGGIKHGNEIDQGSAPRSGSIHRSKPRRDEDGFAWPDPPLPKAPIAKIEEDVEEDSKPKEYPKLPGFKPPPHRYANYGLVVSSTAASSDDESEDTLPRSSLNAPIEALHQLANAADQAAKENAQLEAENRRQGFLSPPRVLQNQLKFKRNKKPDPTPRNAFPDVVTKGLVTPEEARELWDIFFSGCHYFIPVFDPSYDEFDSFIQRTPFSFDGMLAVAAKIRAGAGPLGRTHTRCLEEAQGIARSTLFGPVVRKEAVMAVLILASWSQDPWLPSGHALRMGLDMNLHKALEKLGEDVGTFGGGKARTDAEERDLVVSARIWLNCYLNDHTVSLGTGRPLMLRDDESVRNARQLLTHPMASETDVRLVACVELMSHKVRVWTHLHPLRGRIDSTTIDFVRRVSNDLLAWHAEWRTRHLQKHEEESVLVKLLDAELYYAQLWTACVALRGCNWDKLNLDQRELAFGAKDAALKCLSAYKTSSLRHYLKYAVHETMVQASFAAVFLLKIAILFPAQVTAKFISQEVSDLANLMSECAAERYALTLRLMLRSFRRKMGETTMAPGTPRTMANGQVAGPSVDGMIPGHRGLESLLSMDGDGAVDFSILDDLGPFNWPEDGFSPSNLPQWITEGNVMDLGLPYDGSDSIFLPPELANMFLPAPTSWQLGDSAETGAEAW